MATPRAHAGLHHVALYVTDLEACTRFYTDILGMHIMWQPDADNIYLTSGTDNLALHRATGEMADRTQQRLDHIGFFLTQREDVDAWHQHLVAQGCVIKAAPKDHRDNTRSFYCADPAGNIVQMIYYPHVQQATPPN